MIDRLASQLRFIKRKIKIEQAGTFVGYVYVIRAGDYIKIGVARDVEKRMETLQSGCPFTLELLRAYPCSKPFSLERTLHWQLRECRVRTEWFKISDAALSKLLSELD